MLKVQEIRELIKLIDQSSIDEFTYESNGTTVTMKKASAEKKLSSSTQVNASEEQAAKKVVEEQVNVSQITEPTSPAKESKESPAATNYDYEIKSPMVGTFYSSPNPESDAYVTVGSTVKNDSVVCIVEAMKLFNEIEAEVNGEIVEVLVENGELVEYGQPLFRVKKK
ncbi:MULTISPECIES: acetyl-CoA carboxylase biotin carboxyl carrier protein [unclassified Virgibacillus]|uniref:acetyl-CoA carboxylase biotin carboxyl carrier protein n=1 Tax=unclassified Virgibacillus TaxID=2620237 RepID=UPI0024DE4482|nr:acetyl-CoA carboxylase biotin carboxyl carrier protein [Virgibacillus sp. LDC-1]